MDYHRHFIFGSRKQKPLVSRGGLHDNHDIHCRVALQSAANCQVPTQHPGDSSTSAPPNVSSKHSVYSSQAQREHNAMVLLVLTREGRIWSLMLCSQHQAPWSSVNSGKRVSKLCTKCQAFVFILTWLRKSRTGENAGPERVLMLAYRNQVGTGFKA